MTPLLRCSKSDPMRNGILWPAALVLAGACAASAQPASPYAPSGVPVPLAAAAPAAAGPASAGADSLSCILEASASPCGPPGRLWLGAEYLYWRISDSRTPALVTTSPPGSAGILG